MNVENIVTRDNRIALETHEMQFVVQEYIKEKKGSNVKINLMKGLNQHDPFFAMEYLQEVNKLMNAYNVAQGYFLNKMN